MKMLVKRLAFVWTFGRSRKYLLPLLLLSALPAMVQAQFTYTTANRAITITAYTGPGGDVTIPAKINGLPVAPAFATFPPTRIIPHDFQSS